MKHYLAFVTGLLLSLLLLTGCQSSQSTFSRSMEDAGASFSAAATILDYTHQGKFTYMYAQSSLESLRGQLEGVEQSLATGQDATSPRTLQSLHHAYNQAMPVIRAPCLADTCDWRTQLTALRAASKAFLEVGGQ